MWCFLWRIAYSIPTCHRSRDVILLTSAWCENTPELILTEMTGSSLENTILIMRCEPKTHDPRSQISVCRSPGILLCVPQGEPGGRTHGALHGSPRRDDHYPRVHLSVIARRCRLSRQGVGCGGAARPLGGWGRDRTMPTTPHLERHFTATATVRDLVIGMSDGLTVPFALAAGLSGAVASASLVVTAGLAEIAAGSIAMGLGGYLAA